MKKQLVLQLADKARAITMNAWKEWCLGCHAMSTEHSCTLPFGDQMKLHQDKVIEFIEKHLIVDIILASVGEFAIEYGKMDAANRAKYTEIIYNWIQIFKDNTDFIVGYINDLCIKRKWTNNNFCPCTIKILCKHG